MIHATLCFVLREKDENQQVLLGLKKRGFGAGKLNGFGGKLLTGESPREAMSRELAEECGLIVAASAFESRGVLVFRFPYAPQHDHRVRVFVTTTFEGKPRETDEMIPEWYPAADPPLDRMWQDDSLWLASILAGRSAVGRFFFSADNESVAKYRLWVGPKLSAASVHSDSIRFAR
ncbi:8-oxo-dGTP diphosphatase [Candidatus Bipolaricaulota bacterium]|nr:8-oxo-dGTP diphosphatase [Candidatus Bipolaricaulota bacterium]